MNRLVPLALVLLAGLAWSQESPEVMFVCSDKHPPSEGPCATAPKVKYNPEPQYSDEARRLNHQGIVVLGVKVDENGEARDIRVSRSLGMGLDEEAIRAVKQWKFEPARFEGKPVPVQINIEVNFRLYGKKAATDSGSASPLEVAGTKADLIKRGWQQRNAHQYDAAIASFRAALQLDPNDSGALNDLGITLFDAGKTDEAEEVLEKALLLRPDHPFAHNNLGRVYWRKKRYNDAAAEFRRQLEVNPDDRYASANLGFLLRSRHDCAQALPPLQKSLLVTTPTAGVYTALGDCFLEVGARDKAMEAFDRALAVSREPSVWNDIAYYLANHDADLDRALKYATTAVTMIQAEVQTSSFEHVSRSDFYAVSRLSAFWDTLGWVHTRRKQYAPAMKYLVAARDLHSDGTVAYHMARTYEDMGQPKEAIEAYATAMTFDDAPDDTRARLEQLAGDRTAADAAVAAAKERSKMIDTVAAPIGVSGNADFVLLTGADGNIEKAEWMKGEESLRPLASSIVRRKTQFQSPDPSVSAILRLGQVKCLNGKCELTLVAANKAGALVPEETANNLLPDEVLRSVPALAAQPPVAAPETDFFNPEVGMKVHLPEGWRLVSETKPTFTTPAQSVLVKVGSLAFFILQREHLEASPEMYRKLRQEHMSSAPNLTVLGESSAVVDGKNADRVTFKVTQEAAELRGWMMFVDNGDEHYGILAMAPADIFDRYAPMYTAMTQSVRFAWRHPEDDFAKSGAASLDREVPGGIATIPPPATASRLRVRVSQTVSQGQLINKVYPKYPAEAKAGHIQGPVVLQVTINQQGEVADLKVLTGNPMLVQAAIDAVKQWRYRPYLFQGKPVEVETTITVNFTLEGN